LAFSALEFVAIIENVNCFFEDVLVGILEEYRPVLSPTPLELQ
jgi:hypothetical protein